MSRSSELRVSSYSVTVACGTFEGATLAKAKRAAAIAQAKADADEVIREQWRAEARAEATAVAYRVLESFVDGPRPVYDELAFPNGPDGDGYTFDRHVSYGDSTVRIRVDEYGPTGAVASFWASKVEAIALGVDGHVRVAWLRSGDDIWPIALGSCRGIAAHVALPKQVTATVQMAATSDAAIAKRPIRGSFATVCYPANNFQIVLIQGLTTIKPMVQLGHGKRMTRADSKRKG